MEIIRKDVVVVGLGAFGSAALWRLAHQGVDVAGIERHGIGHHLGSSHALTAHVAQAEPVHLSNHHRATLRQIFQHPVSHNVEWHAVVSLVETVGSVVRHHDGKVAVTVGSERIVVEPPAHKDIDVQTVLDLRRMLSAAGYGPESGH